MDDQKVNIRPKVFDRVEAGNLHQTFKPILVLLLLVVPKVPIVLERMFDRRHCFR